MLRENKTLFTHYKIYSRAKFAHKSQRLGDKTKRDKKKYNFVDFAEMGKSRATLILVEKNKGTNQNETNFERNLKMLLTFCLNIFMVFADI